MTRFVHCHAQIIYGIFHRNSTMFIVFSVCSVPFLNLLLFSVWLEIPGIYFRHSRQKRVSLTRWRHCCSGRAWHGTWAIVKDLDNNMIGYILVKARTHSVYDRSGPVLDKMFIPVHKMCNGYLISLEYYKTIKY